MIGLYNCNFTYNNDFRLQIDSLEINKGETFILVGPSGSGKTSLLKILSGLEKDFQGSYYINGIEHKRLPKLHQRKVMYLSQELFLWEHLNVQEHINFVLNNGDIKKEHLESDYFLESVNLLHKKDSNISKLSTGERQRLALARALSSKTDYYFLDEPFSNIDVVLASELNKIIRNQQEKYGFSIITSTHNHIGLNENVKIIILVEGKIIQKGTWNEISTSPKTDWIKKWLDLV